MRHLLEHSPINGKIIVLQPRRVVVRALATYIATSLGEHVGDRVGYQIRGETKHSKSTQLLFVTEAILARRLMTDPELADVGLIVFDESMSAMCTVILVWLLRSKFSKF
jgi:ATP-dependent helicase HrpB